MPTYFRILFFTILYHFSIKSVQLAEPDTISVKFGKKKVKCLLPSFIFKKYIFFKLFNREGELIHYTRLDHKLNLLNLKGKKFMFESKNDMGDDYICRANELIDSIGIFVLPLNKAINLFEMKLRIRHVVNNPNVLKYQIVLVNYQQKQSLLCENLFIIPINSSLKKIQLDLKILDFDSKQYLIYKYQITSEFKEIAAEEYYILNNFNFLYCSNSLGFLLANNEQLE